MFTHLNQVALKAAKQRGVPVVVTPRDALSEVYLAHRRWEKRVFVKLWERRLLTEAAAVHALHETERVEVASLAPTLEKTWIISNACASAGRTQWPSGDAFRQLLGIAPSVPLVLFMSRLHPLKGVELLCRAFHSVRRRVPEAILALAGNDGGALVQVHREASDLLEQGAIRLVGHLTGELKHSALVAADVFALTSRAEGIPNSVLEALSAGTPCAITETCHLPAVQTHHAGRVTSLEPSEIAEALVELLLASPEARTEMGRNGATYVSEAHHPDHIARLLEELYRHCAHPPHRRRP
jgi:glycosyltransferase involved in cell wall biosynthesis